MIKEARTFSNNLATSKELTSSESTEANVKTVRLLSKRVDDRNGILREHSKKKKKLIEFFEKKIN